MKKQKSREQKLANSIIYLEEERHVIILLVQVLIIIFRDILMEKLNKYRDSDYDPEIIDKERQDVKKELNNLLNEREAMLEQIS